MHQRHCVSVMAGCSASISFLSQPTTLQECLSRLLAASAQCHEQGPPTTY
jgi:hypothetical protein